jgi:hypothetical protein
MSALGRSTKCPIVAAPRKARSKKISLGESPLRYIRLENNYVQEGADSSRRCALAREGEVKTSTTIALAALLSGSPAAYAQTEQPTPPYHHYQVHRWHGPHHEVHHRFVAHNPVPAAAPTAPQTNQMFEPYAHPGEGDDDGLSRDPDDCMKGCIGGNPG